MNDLALADMKLHSGVDVNANVSNETHMKLLGEEGEKKIHRKKLPEGRKSKVNRQHI